MRLPENLFITTGNDMSHFAKPALDGASIARRLPRAMLAVALGIACAAASPSFAQKAERSGKEVVDSLCVSCHGTGANGAPKIGDEKAWANRASRGLTSLSKSAL